MNFRFDEGSNACIFLDSVRVISVLRMIDAKDQKNGNNQKMRRCGRYTRVSPSEAKPEFIKSANAKLQRIIMESKQNQQENTRGEQRRPENKKNLQKF
uniref:Uncharacterized protein n=1 Tax=Panagrolaimus sp. JU765 TaxID=591449 RepID=A0AC34PYY4_9BILA